MTRKEFTVQRTKKRRIPPLLISLLVLLAAGLISLVIPGGPLAPTPSKRPDTALDQMTDPEVPLQVHFLDVGQGAAALLVSDGHAVVIDGGGRGTSSFFVAYLKEHGVTSLDAVIATHFDEDHIAGLIGAMNVFPAAEVFAPSYASDTKIYHSFMNMAENKNLTVRPPSPGETLTFGSAALRFLGPSRFDHEKENDNSLSVLVSGGGCRFLFTGDLETEGEAELLASNRPLRTDVLAVGHHGSAYSTSEELLSAAAPTYAVISVGADNGYGHPAASVLGRLRKARCTVLRTDESGTIILTAHKKTVLPG